MILSLFYAGGVATCLAAGRLADSLKILVLEAGLHTKDIFAHTQPAQYLSHLAPTSKTVTLSNPAKEIGGRWLIIPSVRCIGSSVNCECLIDTSVHK